MNQLTHSAELGAQILEQKPHEECGVFGLWFPEGASSLPVAAMTHDALASLQHRGQDGAGVFVSDGRETFGYKEQGLVKDVFAHGAGFIDATKPRATMAVGHVRYGTTEVADPYGAIQPLAGKRTGITVAHNGQVNNMSYVGHQFNVTTDEGLSDSQLVTRTFDKVYDSGRYTIADTARLVGSQMDGAFSIVIMDESRREMVAMRDPWGIRPLSMGRLPDGGYVFASETVAFDAVGATFVRDVEPGEVVAVSDDGIESRRIERDAPTAKCYFEYAYFMDPESQVRNEDGELTTVGEVRKTTGRLLAGEHPVTTDPELSVVVGIPASGMLAAEGYAEAAGLPLVPAAEKAKDAERSFIKSTQEERVATADGKLIFYPEFVRGKHVYVVDDSIVRGTSMIINAEKLYEMGALSVHVRIPTPPNRDSCIYGVNICSPEELIAHNRTIDQVREKLEVDSLGYLSEAGVERAINIGVGNLCMRCVNSEDKVRETPIPHLGTVMLGMPRLQPL